MTQMSSSPRSWSGTALAVIAASVVILTAGYILWTIQRVYLGAEYKGPHGEALVPMTRREFAIGAPLLALAVFFGVYPQAMFNYIEPSVQKTTRQMHQWITHVKQPAVEDMAASSGKAEETIQP